MRPMNPKEPGHEIGYIHIDYASFASVVTMPGEGLLIIARLERTPGNTTGSTPSVEP